MVVIDMKIPDVRWLEMVAAVTLPGNDRDKVDDTSWGKDISCLVNGADNEELKQKCCTAFN